MSTRAKIFTTHEKPEAADPADRVLLVREGFAWGAFFFGALWLAYNRLWLAAFAYLALCAAAMQLGAHFGLDESLSGLAQAFLQLMLGFFAYDLQRWTAGRHGYRMTGVVVAETPLNAHRRYYDYAA